MSNHMQWSRGTLQKWSKSGLSALILYPSSPQLVWPRGFDKHVKRKERSARCASVWERQCKAGVARVLGSGNPSRVLDFDCVELGALDACFAAGLLKAAAISSGVRRLSAAAREDISAL